MKTINYVVLAVLCVMGFIAGNTQVAAAEMIGKSYPYYIFQDGDVVRWCEDPANYAKEATCWTKGVASICEVLPKDEGYLGTCKEIKK